MFTISNIIYLSHVKSNSSYYDLNLKALINIKNDILKGIE